MEAVRRPQRLPLGGGLRRGGAAVRGAWAAPCYKAAMPAAPSAGAGGGAGGREAVMRARMRRHGLIKLPPPRLSCLP